MAIYNGNRVAYGSGGHYYVQVEVWDNGPTSAPTTGLHIAYRIIFENSMNDNLNTINGHDPLGSWDASNQQVNGPGTHLAAFREFECGIQVGGSIANIGFTVSGLAGAAASSVNFDYPMPGRYLPPDPPTAVVTAIEVSRVYGAVSAAGSENGASADYCNYRVLRAWDGAFLNEVGGPGIGYAGTWVPGLPRWTDCDLYVQTHNIAGYGGWSVPVRFRTLPQAPTSPPTAADTFTPTSARIVVYPSVDNGGPNIDRYEAYVMTNNANPGAGGDVVASAAGGTFTATGLQPSKQYFYTARSRNDAGLWSPWTPMQAFTTLPSANIKVGTVWQNAVPYVNDALGIPRMAIPYKNVGGVWKQ